eukprot:6481828-Lingulodinium_polyedra.AAC.1
MSKSECQEVFLRMIGARPTDVLPERRMQVEKFIGWYCEQYKSHGRCLDGIELSESMDWMSLIGVFTFVEEDGEIQSIRHTDSGQEVPLTMHGNPLHLPSKYVETG